ncbi:GNAT family N-acetyltransferase [Anaerosporobacter sp.]|uniref:GNAT family N-acetyltransferase n=1 Tax=Anaerosporobacter sp. TaxID=1872529 RepID=UPI00286EE20F|nr:GNAT family N-acetyltransferase [Anaerosporobacter sp.]
MQIKIINTEQLSNLYKNYLVYDFPESELKPLAMIKTYMEHGIYTIYGLYEEEELLAYAMFVNNKESEFALLDYFASNRKYRSKGYGSTLLQMLKENDTVSKGYIIEVESLRTAKDEEERVIRERRIAFYEKNGLRKTAIRACVYGVEFDILYLPLCVEAEDSCLYEELKALYLLMFGEEKYREQTTVQLL